MPEIVIEGILQFRILHSELCHTWRHGLLGDCWKSASLQKKMALAPVFPPLPCMAKIAWEARSLIAALGGRSRASLRGDRRGW